MKRNTLILLTIFGSVILVIALYIGGFFWIVPKMHDETLTRFSDQLFSVQLPADTTQIDSISVIGQQFANGNHCDYLAARLLETSLQKEKLENDFKENYHGTSELQFIWLDESNAYTDDIFDSSKIYSLDDWLDQHAQTSKADVIVYLFEGHMTSSFDYRCR